MRRLACFIAAASAACTTSSTSQPGAALQMNDLSVLFPMATTQSELAAYLTPSSAGPDGPLLPEALYRSDPGAISLTGLRVVGFRLDPCFGAVGPIADAATCDNQIRLIFQPIFGDAPTAVHADDAAVHVMYALTRDQVITAAREIAAARVAIDDSDLGPLAVHPLVARDGLTGALAQQLMAIAAKYADGTQIERITTFEMVTGGTGTSGGSGLGDIPVAWDMHGMTLASGVETPIAIPTLGAGTTQVSVNVTAAPLDSTFVPETTAPDNLDLLASASRAMTATPQARQAAYDAALRIENPNRHSADTIDCASCHMAAPARALVGEPLFGLAPTGNANAFVADPGIPAADLAGSTAGLVDPADAGINIHAFSYRFATPMINQRVINETAAILAYLRPLVAAD